MPQNLLSDIERTREVPLTFTWTAPRDGIVLERNVSDGMRVMPGDVMFRIADHSHVWAMVDVADLLVVEHPGEALVHRHAEAAVPVGIRLGRVPEVAVGALLRPRGEQSLRADDPHEPRLPGRRLPGRPG